MSNNQNTVSCHSCGNTNNTSAPKPCGATTTACGSCVPTCHWDVETYQELSDNRSKYAGTYVTVRGEGNAVYHVGTNGEILQIWATTIEDDTFVPTVGAYKKTRVINQTTGMIYEYLIDGTYMQYPATHVTV